MEPPNSASAQCGEEAMEPGWTEVLPARLEAAATKAQGSSSSSSEQTVDQCALPSGTSAASAGQQATLPRERNDEKEAMCETIAAAEVDKIEGHKAPAGGSASATPLQHPLVVDFPSRIGQSNGPTDPSGEKASTAEEERGAHFHGACDRVVPCREQGTLFAACPASPGGVALTQVSSEALEGPDPPPRVAGVTNLDDPYDYHSEDSDSAESAVAACRLDLAALCARIAADREALAHLEGQKVVIVLGKTGAGKTTFLHFIAQRRLTRERYYEKDVFVAAEGMDGFTIGHEQASETKSIRHYERKGHNGADPVLYLDTPGYGDSDGPLVDLATSISFRRVARVCKQLRFLVLINAASFMERGDAIKEVASLISSFVGDFNEHRFVFSFLFTHTDSLKETQGIPMATVKTKLIEWLELTRKGTKCDKTKEVLRWMRSCLQKPHPFVDVFHPELSTLESLVAVTEKFEILQPGNHQAALGLTAGKSARQVVRCGMTGPQESTLKLELNSLSVRLCDSVQNERLDVFPELVRILVQLNEYIGNTVTRAAWTEGEDLLKRKREKLMAEIDELIIQGVDLSQSFSPQMCRRAFECMEVLTAFLDLCVEGLLPQDVDKGLLTQLGSGLEELRRSLCTELNDPKHRDLASTEAKLRRMQMWAEVHADFVPMFQAGLDALRAWIATAVRAGQEEQEEEDMQVSTLDCLQQVLHRSTGLSELGLSAEGAEEALTRASNRLSQRIGEASDHARAAITQVQVVSAEEEGSMTPKEAFRIFQSHSASLEHLAGLLAKTSNLHELEQAAAAACSSLLQEVQKVVTALHEDVVAGAAEAGCCTMEKLELRVKTFHSMLAHLTDQQCTETSATPLFDDALQNIMAAVARLVPGIRQQCQMLRTVGIGEPEEHVQPLQALAQLAWLDAFSEGPRLSKGNGSPVQEKHSINALLTEFEGKYSEHFHESARRMTRALEVYLKNPRECRGQLTEVRTTFVQATSASYFASVFPNVASSQLQLEDRVHDLIKGWSQGRGKNNPESVSFSLASHALHDSGESLSVCSALSFLSDEGSRRLLEDVSTNIKLQLQPYVDRASTLVSTEGQFKEKAELAAQLTSWEQAGLTDLLELFPAPTTFEEKVKKEVETLSSRTGAAITDGKDRDLVESLLQQLQEARHLDDHFGGLVSRDLVLLEDHWKLQQTRLNEALRKKIESCNFAGIEDHLTPLLSSKNPAVKEQLREVVECIRSSLSSRLAAARASLHSGQDVASHTQILDRAAEAVGKLLREHTSLDIHESVQQLKISISEQCQERLKHLEAALDPLDGPSLLNRCHAAQSYFSAVSCIVGGQFFVHMASIVEGALHRLERVLPLCDKFLLDVRKQSDKHIDTTELLELLRQLQRAGAAEEPSGSHQITAEIPPASLWLVIGGRKEGGAKVSESKGGKELPERLAYGSLVAELKRDGDWIQYKRLRRTGPATGWVRTSSGGGWLRRKEEMLVEVDKIWEVPKSSGGVMCQIAENPASASTDSLAAGAQVQELDLRGDRLRFKLLTGDGPLVGWTHFTLDGDEVLSPIQMCETSLTTQHCANLYAAAAGQLGQGVNKLHQLVCRGITEDHLHSMAVCIYSYLKTELEGGVLSHATGLEFDVSTELGKVHELEQQTTADQTRLLDQQLSVDIINQVWAPMLDRLRANTRSGVTTFFGYWVLPEYQRKCGFVATTIQEAMRQAQSQLKAGKFDRAGSLTTVLFHACDRLRSHITDPQTKAAPDTLTTEVRHCLQKFHGDLGEALRCGNDRAFEMLFLNYHKFMHHLAPIVKVLLGMACRLHEDLLKTLEAREKSLHDKIDALNFLPAAEEVHTLRKFGRVLTGIFALYRDDLRSLVDDEWLQRIGQLSTRHFGRTALLGPHFAVLEVPPHASEEDIKKAYKDRSRYWHPDTHARRGVHETQPSAMQQRVVQAFEELRKPCVREEYQRSLNEPFSEDIRELRRTFLQRLEGALSERNYRHVQELLAAGEHLHVLAGLACPPLDSKSLCRQMHEKVKEHAATARKSLFTNWDKKQLERMQEDLDKLNAMEKHLSAHNDILCGDGLRDIAKAVESEIREVSRQALTNFRDRKPTEGDKMHFALHLVRLGHILDHLPQFKDFTIMIIGSMLELCQTKYWGHQFLFHVGMLLERGSVGQRDSTGAISSGDQRVSRIIVSEFRQFKEVLTVVWNEQTEVTQKDVSATVREIVARQVVEGRISELEINRDHLLVCYKNYVCEYDTHFHKWRSGQLDLDGLAGETKELAAKLPTCCTSDWSAQIKEAVPKLLARVFVYFTISESGESYARLAEWSESYGGSGDDGDSEQECTLRSETVLKKPHNMQVISILQMLGCNDPDGTRLNSHLMQIRTGEGKSMLLGGCAAVLGLLGFRVWTVCYSAYLSQRDWNLFSGVFSAFGVSDRVTYGQIGDFCEHNIAAKGDVRALTEDLFRGVIDSSQKRHRCAHFDTGEILLVDEVDVFFGPDFYGRTRNPSAFLEQAEVTQILHEVWKSRTQANNPQRLFAKIKASPSYEQLVDHFPDWHFFIESEVQSMCAQVAHFDEPPYHFNSSTQQIGYQELDGVSYDTVYGYRTAFAYLHEASKMTIRDPEKMLRRALCLDVRCGSFSYANIKPACILGVSGTISAFGVGDYEWQVLNRYGVHSYCEMPSVYGRSKLRTLDQEDVKPIIVSDSKDDWFLAITDQVHEMASRGRASIVVFKPKSLEEYKASAYYRKIVNGSELHESLTHQEREFVIKKAAMPGHTTFMSEAFGRGSDFFCFDRSLQDSGGVHVIITSFPLERSLEMQIDGRTARQGQKGSRAMVLLAEELRSTLHVSLTSIRQGSQPSELYRLLDEARIVQHRKACEKIEKDLQQAKELDCLSHNYLDALLTGDRAAAVQSYKLLYDKLHRKPKRQSRLVCLSDATGSMEGLWSSTRDHIQEMLRRVEEIGGDHLELIWMAYRDYCDGPKLLETSGWTNDATTLKTFVSSIVCDGGGDEEEAVEHALAETRLEHKKKPITRVLLLGDAAGHGESCGTYLPSHKHTLATDYRMEALRLAELNIPVYSFYLGQHAKACFTEIANTTGGAVAALTDPNGLIDVVCENALEDIGGSDLVAEYKARYSGNPEDIGGSDLARYGGK